eukprot:3061073-Rhodomonas_salina.1
MRLSQVHLHHAAPDAVGVQRAGTPRPYLHRLCIAPRSTDNVCCVLPVRHGGVRRLCSGAHPIRAPHRPRLSSYVASLPSRYNPATGCPVLTSAVCPYQKGDCTDMSILLASLLIGVGYDAYVVIGYADKTTCLADETKVGGWVDGGKVGRWVGGWT